MWVTLARKPLAGWVCWKLAVGLRDAAAVTRKGVSSRSSGKVKHDSAFAFLELRLLGDAYGDVPQEVLLEAEAARRRGMPMPRLLAFCVFEMCLDILL